MCKIISTLLICFVASKACAIPIQMNFTAYGFGNTAPTRPVTGSVLWLAETVNSRIDSLISIDLTLDGHTYSLEEIAFDSPAGSGSDAIGGRLNGYNSIGPGTDDFIILWDRVDLNPNVFAYTSSSVPVEFFEGRLFSHFSVTEAVSTPATFALFGLALSCFGLSRRRI